MQKLQYALIVAGLVAAGTAAILYQHWLHGTLLANILPPTGPDPKHVSPHDVHMPTGATTEGTWLSTGRDSVNLVFPPAVAGPSTSYLDLRVYPTGTMH